MSSFVHLHNHTEYSVLDGATKISALVKKAAEYKMPSVAITDHGTMHGCADFYLEAKKHGVKPIIGFEAYLAPTDRFDRTNTGMRNAYYHLILLAKNDEGYRNLMELTSRGFTEGFYYKPRIDKDLLRKFSGGLVCSSACLKGEIQQAIMKGNIDKAKKAIEEYQSFFEKGDFYLEIMDHNIPEQAEVNKELINLSREMNVPIIATNDCHYLEQKDAYAHDVLLCIQTGSTINEAKRMRFQTREFYLKSQQEMESLFSHVPEALKNTLEIDEKCNLEIDFSRRLLPHFTLPEGFTNDKYLEHLCNEGLKKRYPTVNDTIIDRLNFELSVIEQMGFVDYFLIVWDFIHYSKREKIPVGPGRGSAAGSIVAYLLGITDIDPLKYDLLFERFLNPARVSMPDIDIDFCYERRGEAINYVVQKYGKNNVAQINTFGTLGAKAVVRDVGRVMGMEYNEVDKIAKLIPNEIKISLKKAVKVNPDLQNLYNNDNQVHTLIETALSLEGNIRNTSTHAAGIVISEKPLTNYVPLCTASNGEISTQYSMKIIEKLGLLKMDFLGLKTLTVLDHTVKFIKKSQNIDIQLDKIPLDDPATYKLLEHGKSIGLFQLESSGMREILLKLQPNRFEDIIALVALYRPGPLGSGMVDDFIKRKHGITQSTYELPELEPILKDTYGIILYQEQVQKISSVLGGFNLGEADLLRRAMGKKIKEEMDQQRERFLKGAAELKFPAKISEEIFDRMAKFAEYGFNKSHSAAYALIAYQTAYFKANYPEEFMAALLSSEMTNPDKITLYLEESKKMGIEILPPDANHSFAKFTVDNKNIRFGLNAVKNVGSNAVESIIRAREEKSPFVSLYDFTKKVDPKQVNKKVIESLVKCGAFDTLGFKRSQLFEIIMPAIEKANIEHEDEVRGQFSLFGSEDDQNNIFEEQDHLPDIPEWSKNDMLQHEKALLGFYVTGHPLDQYKKIFEMCNFQKINGLKKLVTGKNIKIAGICSTLKITTTRRDNSKMAIMSIEDYNDTVEVLAYPKTFANCQDNISVDTIVMIDGKLEINDERVKIIADDIVPIKNILTKKLSSLKIKISSDMIDESQIEKLQKIISHYPGRCPVFFDLEFPDSFFVTLQSSDKFSILPSDYFINEIEEIAGKNSIALKL